MTGIGLKYFSVYILSTFKFIVGIITGAAAGLSVVETATFTFLGAMTTIVVAVLIGNKYRRAIAHIFTRIKRAYYSFLISIILKLELYTDEKRALKISSLEHKKLPKRFTKTIRIALKTWNKFGIFGIAVLTPILLSPIGGAIIAVSFRVSTKKILINMFITNLICAFLFTYAIIEFKEIIESTFGIELYKKQKE